MGEPDFAALFQSVWLSFGYVEIVVGLLCVEPVRQSSVAKLVITTP